MGIIIEKGTTKEAREELIAYIMAFPALEMKPGYYYVFDPTDGPMYQDMEQNAYKGTFDPLTLI